MRGSHIGVRYLDDQLKDEYIFYLKFTSFDLVDPINTKKRKKRSEVTREDRARK